MTDKLEARSIKTCFKGYSKESLGYCFYLPEDYNVIVSHHATFLKNQFVQDGGSERLIELEKKVSKEQRVDDPINNEPIDVVPPPSHRSDRIFHPLERYLSIITEDVKKM